MLLRANFRWRWPAIVEIEGGSEEGERESADAEGKMRSTVAENHTGPTTKRAGAKPTLRLGLGTLTWLETKGDGKKCKNTGKARAGTLQPLKH